MSYFHYEGDRLFVESLPLSDIAKNFGTPCYVYSRAAIENQWLELDKAFQIVPHRICYAVKANSNVAILNLLARLGSGFDIVSQGELERVIQAGGDPEKIVFSGVGKKPGEILRALELGIACFHVESREELERIQTLAKQTHQIAKIALRVNPNIDAKTHPYIATGMKENKFGISIEEVLNLADHLTDYSHLKLVGLAFHIGSQITELKPFSEAMDCMIDLLQTFTMKNISLKHVSVGGGLGVAYHKNDTPPSLTEYVNLICEKLKDLSLEILIEPGRSIVAKAGVLITEIEYIKETPHKNFAIVDAAMNDLIRPALYDAWQNIKPLLRNTLLPKKIYDIVGPICESSDVLGKERELQIASGELLAICGAGAYGFSMSSTYNSRPRVAEILVDKTHMYLIREREQFSDLFAKEHCIP